MEKKPYLVPNILGVLFAFSFFFMTACDELDDFPITIINLSEVRPRVGKTPEYLEEVGKSAWYKRAVVWQEKTITNGKETFTNVEMEEMFVPDGVYEAVFTLTASGGCFFDLPEDEIYLKEKIILKNYLQFYKEDTSPNKNEIKVTVLFLPVDEIDDIDEIDEEDD